MGERRGPAIVLSLPFRLPSHAINFVQVCCLQQLGPGGRSHPATGPAPGSAISRVSPVCEFSPAPISCGLYTVNPQNVDKFQRSQTISSARQWAIWSGEGHGGLALPETSQAQPAIWSGEDQGGLALPETSQAQPGRLGLRTIHGRAARGGAGRFRPARAAGPRPAGWPGPGPSSSARAARARAGCSSARRAGSCRRGW